MTDNQLDGDPCEAEARSDMPAPLPPPDDNRGVAYYQIVATSLVRALRPDLAGMRLQWEDLRHVDPNGIVRAFIRQQTKNR